MKIDLALCGGMLLDGRGGEARLADVGIAGDTLVAIADPGTLQADRRFDLSGHFLAPGFIDVHSHSDAYILIEPSAASKIHQGITTEVVGQCGASASPLLGEYKMPSDWREMEYPGSWSSTEEYKALLAEQQPAVNIATLTGHNTLRAGVMGYEPRPATLRERERMQSLLRESMEAGSRGLSTGLLYPPGKHATRDEVVELAKVVASFDGIYATHMRNEGEGLLEAIDECIDIARQSGAQLQISHFKTSTPKAWDLLEPALERIARAQAEGIRIHADRYPYLAGCTDLDVLLPDWVFAEGPAQELAWLNDPVMRATIRDEVIASREPADWQRVQVGSTHHPDNAPFKGQPILSVAEQLGMEPVDAILHLIMSDELKTGGIFFGMSEENMWKILELPYVMLGSDASLRALNGPLSHDHPHPRAYGSFPRVLRAALDGKTLPLQETIRKMTSLPAETFHLEKRGVVEEGYKADLVVFSDLVTDRSTYEKPHATATGFKLVLVNGVMTLIDDEASHARGGIFL